MDRCLENIWGSSSLLKWTGKQLKQVLLIGISSEQSRDKCNLIGSRWPPYNKSSDEEFKFAHHMGDCENVRNARGWGCKVKGGWQGYCWINHKPIFLLLMVLLDIESFLYWLSDRHFITLYMDVLEDKRNKLVVYRLKSGPIYAKEGNLCVDSIDVKRMSTRQCMHHG